MTEAQERLRRIICSAETALPLVGHGQRIVRGSLDVILCEARKLLEASAGEHASTEIAAGLIRRSALDGIFVDEVERQRYEADMAAMRAQEGERDAEKTG